MINNPARGKGKSANASYSTGHIQIKGHSCEVLLDTGADISVVNIQIIESLSESQLILWDREPYSSNLIVRGQMEED